MITVPVKPWVSRTATFAWDRRGAPSSQCSLDGSKWTKCVSPKTYGGLALGTHVFGVRGVGGSQHSSVNEFTLDDHTRVAARTSGAHRRARRGHDLHRQRSSRSTSRRGWGPSARSTRSGWQPCSSPAIYVGLGAGQHTFCVRSVGPNGIPSPPSCTTWFIHGSDQPAAVPPPAPPLRRRARSRSRVTSRALLAPGLGGPVPVTITNPLSFPLTVTDLVVTVAAGSSHPGCNGAANLGVAQSNMAGGAVSVVVPAAGSVTLPAQGATAPVVTMLNLGVEPGRLQGCDLHARLRRDGDRMRRRSVLLAVAVAPPVRTSRATNLGVERSRTARSRGPPTRSLVRMPCRGRAKPSPQVEAPPRRARRRDRGRLCLRRGRARVLDLRLGLGQQRPQRHRVARNRRDTVGVARRAHRDRELGPDDRVGVAARLARLGRLHGAPVRRQRARRRRSRPARPARARSPAHPTRSRARSRRSRPGAGSTPRRRPTTSGRAARAPRARPWQWRPMPRSRSR